MVHQIGLGRDGWLQSNYRELQRFQMQNPNQVHLEAEKGFKAFRIRIAGVTPYQGHYLVIRCLYPRPGQPPQFELLNAPEISRLRHPHIREIYVCLKAPWTPNTPISAPLRAICQAWWRPTH